MMLFRNLIMIAMLASGGCDFADNDSATEEIAVEETAREEKHTENKKHSQQNFTAAIILDGTALTQTWQRFFALDAEILDAKQQRDLGSLSYDGQDASLRNGHRYREVKQNYIKTLRTVLLQLCQHKTDQELQAVIAAKDTDTFAQHAIVKRNGLPQQEDVNAMMTAMFGYQAEHHGAAEYAGLMQENLAAVQQDSEVYQQKLRANYVLLCMAIGQDARVYLR